MPVAAFTISVQQLAINVEIFDFGQSSFSGSCTRSRNIYIVHIAALDGNAAMPESSQPAAAAPRAVVAPLRVQWHLPRLRRHLVRPSQLNPPGQTVADSPCRRPPLHPHLRPLAASFCTSPVPVYRLRCQPEAPPGRLAP
eukprot:CAMPEP_0206139898 /NCGR_PEP_ID=MMETSP1473-20131121/7765_1 /ASSEMBLY_ACC=CAM_ASM_001109 /TAXON_ID=1461547 /ORGANISM="Stichococcus sp, Strain RCC1054" /LENGTH=139 /DNA_ID=CAMNT_0053533845 /DNA_START=288 /DNA_END=707 /DNA_ORIENTATION=-